MVTKLKGIESGDLRWQNSFAIDQLNNVNLPLFIHYDLLPTNLAQCQVQVHVLNF